MENEKKEMSSTKRRQKFTKNKRSNYRSKSSDDPKVTQTRASHNDASWYTTNLQAVTDVASFSFNTALGQPTTLYGTPGTVQFNVPGVFSILTVPAIGVGKDANSPVNIAARKLYSFVRHANSGHANYDPADLMIYLLSMDSVYSFWSWMVRAYGTAQVFSQTNRYVGDAYIQAMGIDPNNLRANLANFRAYINMFAIRASQFCVPAVMSYFVRHSWMYSNIYKDEDTSRASAYMYVPAGFYRYNPVISEGAGGLEFYPLTVNVSGGFISDMYSNSVSSIIGYGNTLLNALTGQEDIGIMSGDILKAYGAEKLWKFQEIPETYAVMPVFSEEVLAQIHNTTFAGHTTIADQGDGTGLVDSLASLSIFQDPNVGSGIIYSNPIFNCGSHLAFDTLIDFWKQDPSPEDVIVASRNLMCGESVDLTGENVARPTRLTSCGSEIVLTAFVSMFNNINGSLQRVQLFAGDYMSVVTDSAPDYMRFNEAPVRLERVGEPPVWRVVGELDTYTPITREELKKLHECVLLSMFDVGTIK